MSLRWVSAYSLLLSLESNFRSCPHGCKLRSSATTVWHNPVSSAQLVCDIGYRLDDIGKTSKHEDRYKLIEQPRKHHYCCLTSSAGSYTQSTQLMSGWNATHFWCRRAHESRYNSSAGLNMYRKSDNDATFMTMHATSKKSGVLLTSSLGTRKLKRMVWYASCTNRNTKAFSV